MLNVSYADPVPNSLEAKFTGKAPLPNDLRSKNAD